MTVRQVTRDDLKLLAEYWYDGMALRSQQHKSVRLATDAEQQWLAYAEAMLDSGETAFLLIERDNDIYGCAIGRVQKNAPGLLPLTTGVIEDIILDLHSPHKQKAAVRDLLAALEDYFRQMAIEHIIVRVPTYVPVAQGFWRGSGLHHIEDTFWMELDT